MYKDSQGIWDGVSVRWKGEDVASVVFFSINELDYDAARKKLIEKENVKNAGGRLKL